jgi:hypothetical protein
LAALQADIETSLGRKTIPDDFIGAFAAMAREHAEVRNRLKGRSLFLEKSRLRLDRTELAQLSHGLPAQSASWVEMDLWRVRRDILVPLISMRWSNEAA